MNSLSLSDFKLHMLNLRNLNPLLAAQYRSALSCWETVWEPVHVRFQQPGHLHVDGFLRQDEGAFIFHRDRCVALTLFRTMDFTTLNYSRDSYFKEWPTGALSTLLKMGQCVFSANSLSVLPEFRKFHPHIKFKQVLMNHMVLRFLESSADLLVNAARQDRGVSAEGLKRGGKIFAENVEIFAGQEKIDIVCFGRDQVKVCEENPNLTAFSQWLWDTRLDWKTSVSADQPEEQPTQNPNSHAKQKPGVRQAS